MLVQITFVSPVDEGKGTAGYEDDEPRPQNLMMSDDEDGDDDKYIMIQCLFVTFLFIPALLPSPVQSCYVWIKRKVESRK